MLLIGLLCLVGEGYGQSRRTYTRFTVGGMLGLAATDTQQPMHGYQLQLAFGRNVYDDIQFGLGIGFDEYRARSTMPDGRRLTRRVNTLPIVAEVHVGGAELRRGRIGLMAQAGYAPGLGNDYYRGFTGQAGATYTHTLTGVDGLSLRFGLGYGFQQFDSSFIANRFSQHSLRLAVGFVIH